MNSRKHFSVEDMQKDLTQFLGSALTSLSNVWEEIGIIEEQRRERTEVVMLHLRNLLDEMVKEEIALEQKLKANVTLHKEEIATLREELNLGQYVAPTGLSVIQLDKELRTEVDTLAKEKHDRMKSLKRLKEKDQHLCDVLCTTPYYIPTGAVPSKEQLEALETHINSLEKEKVERHGIFVKCRKDIAAMLDDLGHTPNTSFERDLICEEEDSFLLSTENMQALKMYHQELEVKQQENQMLSEELRLRLVILWDRLDVPEDERAEVNARCHGYKNAAIEGLRTEIERCEVLKLQNMKRFVEGMRKELITWWDKCYFNDQQREEFRHMRRDDYCEELLETHELEVSAMKRYYETNQDMLDRVARREKLWEEMVQADIRAKDVNRFSNRGGNLLQEEKARKKVMATLPKVEEKLKEQISEWETTHNKEFLVYGKRFVDYIENQWEEYQYQKENEKNQRHKAKEREMQQEMIYGSKPTTPAKRRFIGTPSKTPNGKMRKLNETKTPGSVSRLTTPRSMSRLATPHSTTRMGMSKVFSSPSLRPPRPALSQKTPRNLRQTPQRSMRKVLGDKNDGDMYSHTTLSSGSSTSSIASTATYQDFAHGLNATSRANCRSSIMPESIAKQGMF